MQQFFGLIMCGGQSLRMGTDKSLLSYHDQPQRYYLYEMLKPFCDRVFISCNEQQSESIPSEYESVVDLKKYSGIGPMAALLSAFEKFPGTSFLVVGCDYPFLKRENMENLISKRAPEKKAICYYNAESKMEEPLLAIYGNECSSDLLRNFHEKKYSLRHFLNEIDAQKIIPDSPEFLQSVDDLETYRRIIRNNSSLYL